MGLSIINVIGWQFCLGFLLGIILVLWLFYGGKDYEYVGLSPLKVGVDSTKYIDESKYNTIDIKNYSKRTSKKSKKKKKSKKTKKYKPKFNHSLSDSYNEPTIKGLVSPCQYESYESYDVSYVKSPNTLALGENKKFKNSNISKGEQICKDVIEKIYNKPFHCVRPSFLKNPETNRNLELDCYNDELKIAVEYNGIQHYTWPNFTGVSYENFIKQVRRDKFKIDQCDKNGVYLITVPYNIKHESIEEYIYEHLPENIVEPEDVQK